MAQQMGCGLKKNDLFELAIDSLGNEGEGIGRYRGFTFFVKDAIPGDVILARVLKLKKNYGYARVEKVLSASPDRVEPLCPVAASVAAVSSSIFLMRGNWITSRIK